MIETLTETITMSLTLLEIINKTQNKKTNKIFLNKKILKLNHLKMLLLTLMQIIAIIILF